MSNETTTAGFRQCEHCFVFVDEAGAALSPQPRFGYGFLKIPEMVVCASCQVNGPPPREVQNGDGRIRKAAPNRERKKARGGVLRVETGTSVHRGCPVEKDLPMGKVETVIPEGGDQAAYMARGEGHGQNATILAHFRKHFGKWIFSGDLEELSGSRRMNSRAADIRRLVKPQGLVVDCMITQVDGSVHSYYRLCSDTDPEYLLHLEERREAKATVHADSGE